MVDTTTSLNGVQFGSKPAVDKIENDNQVENKQNETKETDSLILGTYEKYCIKSAIVRKNSMYIIITNMD